ncbi:MAG: histidine kinase [Saprospiraceae bacterium]|nr:histidine kinase [Saprospiraceae bacterium]
MLHTLLSGRGRFITHLIGWVLLALLLFTLVSGLRDSGEVLGRTAMNMVFLVVMFYSNAKILVNRFFETGRFRLFIPLVVVFWLGMAALRAVLEQTVFGGSVLDGPLPRATTKQLFLAFSLSFFLLLLFSTVYQLLENRLTLELRHRELQVQHTEAQLNYLKAQINPHFLFNTLNNIYAAATLQHPNTAAMVLRLSDLLRYVTYDGQQALVPLEKEVAQVKAYLELFKLRSEQAPAIEFRIEDQYPVRTIEPVLLLPLVENALKHGDLDDNPGTSFLNIRLENTRELLAFTVENSFDPENRQKDSVGGVGLENIRRRLELHYPGRHRFSVQDEGTVFNVRVEIFYV